MITAQYGSTAQKTGPYHPMKGQKGAGGDFKGVQLTRTSARGGLKTAEIKENWRISSDRVIAENYFGLITSLSTLHCRKYF